MYTPTAGDVHVNTPLTQISIAYLQNQDQFVAASVCPVIPVSKQSDRYYVYNRGDFFRDQMQKRAPGTPAASTGYRLDNTPTYFCDMWAESKPIPDQLRGNADAVLNMDRDAPMLSDEVHDAPPPVPLLDVPERERRHFGPAKAAAEEHRQNSPVAQTFGRGCVRRVQQLLRLLD
jgi:hypothetical protein